MRWWHVVALALGLCGAGCGANAPFGNNCFKRLKMPPPPPVLLALEGRPVSVVVEFPLALSCAGGNPIATSVETQVLDARLMPVPHQASAPTSSDTEGYAVRVDFTPRTPGLFSLSARFEPGLGVGRREVLVAVDRTASAPRARLRASGFCDDVAEIGDAVLCARAEASSVDVFSRADGLWLARWSAEVASFAPGAAWTLAGGRATRWVAGDGGLAASSLDGIDAGFPGLTHAATSDVLRLVSGRDFTELRWNGAVLEVGRRRTLPVASTGRSGLLVLEDGQALAFDAAVEEGAPAPDGGGVDAGVTPAQLCHVSLGPAPDAGVVCRQARLSFGAVEGDALWLRAQKSRRVGLLRFLPGAQTPDVVFLAAQPVEMVDQGWPLPFFRWNTFTLVVERDGLLLEAFAPPWDYVRTGASATHVWFFAADGGLEVHRR